jgi:hypothetical protein
MENITNMECSLKSINDLLLIQIENSIRIESVWYICEYPFLKINDYEISVKDYIVKHNNSQLHILLEKHLNFCNKMIDNYNKVKSIKNNCIELLNNNNFEEYKQHFELCIAINGKDSNYVGLNLYCRFARDTNEFQFIQPSNRLSRPSLFNPFDKRYILEISNFVNKIKRVKDFLYMMIKTFNLSQSVPIYPQQLTIPIPDNILNELQQAGFIENIAARPLKWVALNKKTKTINKKSLLDLLCLLQFPDNVIKDRKLLNSSFIFSNNCKLISQNYTDITDNKGNIKRPIISEYHTELENIINQINK